MKEFGLPKGRIIRKTGEFDRVYRSGQRFRGNGFVVIVLPSNQAESRLGISVQRKAGNAVRRNRIKRLVREVFRLRRELFPLSSDIVVTIRREFAIDSFQEMAARVQRAVTARQCTS